MDADKDNANPTILNPSDLPTRHQPSSAFHRADGGTGLFDGLIPSSSYLEDPLGAQNYSSDADSEEVEPIDEQEVYGNPESSALDKIYTLT